MRINNKKGQIKGYLWGKLKKKISTHVHDQIWSCVERQVWGEIWFQTKDVIEYHLRSIKHEDR